MSYHPVNQPSGCGCRLLLRGTLGLAALGFGLAMLAPGQSDWAMPALIVSLVCFLLLWR